MGHLNYFIIEPVGGHGGMNYYNTGLGQGLVLNNATVHLYTCPESQEQSSSSFTINKFFKGVYGKTNKVIRLARFVTALTRSIIDIKRKGGKICHLHFSVLAARVDNVQPVEVQWDKNSRHGS